MPVPTRPTRGGWRINYGTGFEEIVLTWRYFCTSQPEDRLPDPLLSIRPGQNFEIEARAATERLRDYLRENIVTSQAYLVLVTRRSLEESRPWVRWEIIEAQAIAKDQTLRFIPCLLDVPSRTLQSMVTALIKSEWEEWEVGAIPDSALRPYEFQGVDVSSAQRAGRARASTRGDRSGRTRGLRNGPADGRGGTSARDLPESVEDCPDLIRWSDGLSNTSAEVRSALAQGPAYRPTQLYRPVMSRNSSDNTTLASRRS